VATETSFDRRIKAVTESRRILGSFVIVFVVVTIGPWLLFLRESQRHPYGVAVLAPITVFLLLGVVAIMIIARKRWPLWLLVLAVLYTAQFILFEFALFYWGQGTIHNFTQPLGHFDAVYFAIGTFATGTGNINAVSDQVRAIQATQMCVDLCFLLLAVGVVVARLGDLSPP
jgi:hypothetical protein